MFDFWKTTLVAGITVWSWINVWVLFFFYLLHRWKSMIWNKFQILLGEKIHVGRCFFFLRINRRVDMLIRASRVKTILTFDIKWLHLTWFDMFWHVLTWFDSFHQILTFRRPSIIPTLYMIIFKNTRWKVKS